LPGVCLHLPVPLASPRDPHTVTDRRTETTASQLHPDEKQAGAVPCAHGSQLRLRLIDYTRYGTWIGCVECGASWLIRSRG
jgi:hypothetical protein